MISARDESVERKIEVVHVRESVPRSIVLKRKVGARDKKERLLGVSMKVNARSQARKSQPWGREDRISWEE